MKFTEVTINDIKQYARVEHAEEDALLQAILDGARSHIRSYTGLDDISLDNIPDTTIALYVISNEMYENRSGTTEKGGNSKFNELLNRILGSHSVNLL